MKYFAVCALLILPLVSGGIVPRIPPTRHFVAYEIRSTHNLPQMEAIVQKMQTLLQNMIPDMSVLADAVAVPDMSVQSDAGVLPDMSVATDADETPRRRTEEFKVAPIAKVAKVGAPMFAQIPDMSVQADAGLIPDISVASDADETPKRASFGLKKPLLDRIAGAIANMDADLIPDMSVATDGDDTPKQAVSGIRTPPKMTKVSGGEPVEIIPRAAGLKTFPQLTKVSGGEPVEIVPRAAGLKAFPQLTKVSGGEPVKIMTHVDADRVPVMSVASDADVAPKQAVAGLKALPKLTMVSGANPVELPDMSVASDAEDKAANQLPDISVAGDAKFDPKMTLAALLARHH
ncbi:uncharacterized protein LOC122617098 [Drosophila teissieri]|uniref:uncharacterized protein LOC122617098 n=1 Tax=Drosophila teissieri TaxID=7243 RepID=UPI001CBA4307|nr:uncharacterized protein LOC122617098 [Drosophila teissieri]